MLERFLERISPSKYFTKKIILEKKYIKVISDKDILEEVGKMELYQEKIQLRYHTPAEAQVIWDKAAEKIARKMLKRGLPIEDIAEDTEIPIKRVQQIAKRYDKYK